MPYELVPVAWCDTCMREHDTKVDAASVHPIVVTLGVGKSAKPREMYFCEVHYKEILAPLMAELEHAPVYNPETSLAPPPPAPARKQRAYPSERKRPEERAEDRQECPVCRDIFGVEHYAKNQSTLDTHRTQRHKMSAVEFKAWRRGDAEVTIVDQEKMEVATKVKPLPPVSDKKWRIPDDFRCDREGCDFVVDPRPHGEPQAYRVLGAHKAKHGSAA